MSDLQIRSSLMGGTGTPSPFTATISGASRVSDAHARFMDAVLKGNVYIGANLAGTGVVTQAGLSATTPALTLYNPVGSGVNLVLWTATSGVLGAPAAAMLAMLAFNVATAAAPTATTTSTLVNANLASTATGKGQCYRIATLAAAPVAIRYMWGTTGAAAIGGTPYVDHVDGEIIVPPGVALSVQTSSAATSPGLVASFTWEEVTIIP